MEPTHVWAAEISERSEGEAAIAAPDEDSTNQQDGEEKFTVDPTEALSSKRTQAPQASTAIITVTPTEELASTGVLTLSDLLRVIPGFDVTQAFWYDWPGARGATGVVNLMLDGVSVTNPLDNQYPAGPGLFLEEFDRVETISGPAGVLWGSHSLLGVVNLLSGRSTVDKTTVRAGYGSLNNQSITLRVDRPQGKGNLRLFAGYAGRRNPSLQPATRFDSVPPYGISFKGGENSTSTAPSLDFGATLSARYADKNWIAHLRLPFTRSNYQISEFGAVLRPGEEGRRDSFNGLASLTYQHAFLNGRLGVISRGTWYLLNQTFTHSLFADQRSIEHVLMSRVNLLLEVNYRLLLFGGQIRSDLMVGVDGTIDAPHSSQFLVSSQELNGGFMERGRVFPNGSDNTASPLNAQTGSAYVADELHWKRFSVTGGGRANVSNTYKTAFLGQLGAAIRLFGESYAKINFTQGLRPPTLLDRIGIQPVFGDPTLDPEVSTAFQYEFNASWSIDGFIKRGFARVDYATTTTRNNVTRQGSSMVRFLQQPVSAPGGASESFEAVLSMSFPWADADLLATYYGLTFNQCSAFDVSQCERAPNHGPQHRVSVRGGASLFGFLRASGSLNLQCGGSWQTLSPDQAQDVSAYRDDRPDPETLGCYPFIGAFVRLPETESQFQISISVDNLFAQTAPVAMFSHPELVGAETRQQAVYGRRVFAMLEWRSETASQW